MEDLIVVAAFHSDQSGIAHIQAANTPVAPEMIDTESMIELQEIVPRESAVALVGSHTDVRRRSPSMLFLSLTVSRFSFSSC